MPQPKVQHRYKVKTVATVEIGDSEYKIPVEFRIKEMPWDKGKSVGQMMNEMLMQSHIHFSWKKKDLTIEKEF